MKRWIPFPASWANDANWHTLTPRARILLHCAWQRSADGTLPTNPKALQIVAGIADRPSRVATAAEELERKGFIEKANGVFFLVQWRTIFAKFGANSGKKVAKNKRTDRAITGSYAHGPRARTLSHKEIEKDRETQGTSEGDPAISSDKLDRLRARFN